MTLLIIITLSLTEQITPNHFVLDYLDHLFEPSNPRQPFRKGTVHTVSCE